MKDNTRQLELDMSSSSEGKFPEKDTLKQPKKYWRWETCGNIIDVRDGTHDTPKYQPIGIPLITSKNLSSNGIDFNNVGLISEEDHIAISKRSRVDRGDILFAMIGTIGNPVVVDDGRDFSIKNVALFKCPKDQVNPRYFYRLLESSIIKKQLDDSARGGTQKFVSLKVLRNLKIPLPPLEEQKRIARILDTADELRAKRRKALAELDTLLQSVFLDMFGDPVTNPKGWKIVQLGDVAKFHAGSTLPPAEDFMNQPHGFIYLKVGDLNHPENLTEIVRANLWGESSQKGIIAPKNSVVIPKRGGAIGTNKKRILTRPAVLDPNLMAVSAGNKLTAQFIFRWFHTFDLMSLTSGSSVPQLNKKDLAPLQIPLPPLELQHHFATIVGKVEQQKAQMRAHLTELDALFASLQHRAFNGEL